MAKQDKSKREYYILSLKHTQQQQDDLLIWWRANNAGYSRSLDNAGRYTQQDLDENPGYYNNGETTVAVPCELAESLSVKVVKHDGHNLAKIAGY